MASVKQLEKNTRLQYRYAIKSSHRSGLASDVRGEAPTPAHNGVIRLE